MIIIRKENKCNIVRNLQKVHNAKGRLILKAHMLRNKTSKTGLDVTDHKYFAAAASRDNYCFLK